MCNVLREGVWWGACLRVAFCSYSTNIAWLNITLRGHNLLLFFYSQNLVGISLESSGIY